MGKITVKHYLNTNLKPYIIDGEKYYKIYVLIRADTQNTKIKSDISSNEYTEKEFIKLIKNESSELNKAVKEETKIIEFIVSKINEDDKVFTSSLFTEYSNRFKTPISEFILNHNKYYDPMFSQDRDRHLEIQYYFKEVVADNLKRIPGLLAINYDMVDLFLIQWVILNIKDDFFKFYKEYCKKEDLEKSDITLKSEVEKLDKEIRVYLNIV